MTDKDKYGDLILKNAQRLIDDAQFLVDGGRIATATSLAILALEECAKYKILYWKLNNINVNIDKSLKGHKKTQFIAANMAYCMDLIAASIAMLQEKGIDYEDIVRGKGDTIEVAGQVFERRPEKWPREWFTEMQSLLAKTSRAKLPLLSRKGFLQEVKHLGLYVSRDSTIPGFHTFEDLGLDTASFYIELATSVLLFVHHAPTDAATRVVLESSELP